MRVREAVHLAGDLRRRVEVSRKRQGRVLVDRPLRRSVPVDPHGAAVHNPADLGVTCGLEDHLRAVDVDPVGVDRVGHDVADVCDGGEVDDRVATAGGAPGGITVGNVAEHGPDLRGRVVRRLQKVEDHRLVAVGDQPVDDVRTDEPGAPGDEDLHAGAATVARATGR